MAKELLVNVSRGEEVRVALVEDGRLEEIYLERDNAASNVGNIYLGKVTNVEGSIQAAFVDFGYGRNGFLHVQDLHPDYFPDGGRWDRMTERVGKKIGRRDRPPIQDCLRRGDHIVVQIIKEGIGTKGPTLTSYPSIPGRMLVAMPGVGQMGVSKNIEDETERRRLRKILDGLEPPKDVGFIIRTAGFGKTKTEIERDFKYLSRLWADIDRQRKTSKPPALLYSEGDLVTRTVRDVWTSDVERVIVDDVETALRIKQFFKLLMPRTKVDVQLYEGQIPLFHAAGIEQEIETMFSRHVPLPNGGSLVIDSTEAVVAIDVNSGKFREHGDAEETAFRMDMEAADEICRQLRLRDLGGVVICDFIDLRYTRHREALFNRLTENFKRDKAKSRHLPMSEFGIVEITRQRMRPDLKKAVFMPCPWSNGTGVIKTPESMALDVMRRLRVAVNDDRVNRVVVRLYPTTALHVLNTKRLPLAELERHSNVAIEIKPDEHLAADGLELDLFDERDVQIQIDALRISEVEKPDQGHKRRRRRRSKGGDQAQGDRAARNGEQRGAETDEDGLIDLDYLVSLGDMKLEEVEDLAQQAAAERDKAEHDPLATILNALRDRDPAIEEEESENGELEAPAVKSEDEQPRGRRRRRRRRGGRDETTEPQHRETEPAIEEAEAEEPAEELEEQAAEAETTAEAAPESPSDGGRRRRRRRRRRGRGGDDMQAAPEPEESSNGSSHAGEAAAEPLRVDELVEEVVDQVIDDVIDAVTDEVIAETSPGEESADEGPRRRRRRRHKRIRSRPLAVPGAVPDPAQQKPAAIEDEAETETEAEAEVEPELDEASALETVEPTDETSEHVSAEVLAEMPVEVEPAAEPDLEPEPATAETPKPRRRRRGKIVRSRPIAVTPKAPAPAKPAEPTPEPVAEAPAEASPVAEPAEELPAAPAKKRAARKTTRRKTAKSAKATKPEPEPDEAEAAPSPKKTTRKRTKRAKKTAPAE